MASSKRKITLNPFSTAVRLINESYLCQILNEMTLFFSSSFSDNKEKTCASTKGRGSYFSPEPSFPKHLIQLSDEGPQICKESGAAISKCSTENLPCNLLNQLLMSLRIHEK